MDKTKKRIKWLDFAKGVAILGVVLGHTITHGILHYNIGTNSNWLISLQFVLFLFVMPCFFVISGYLYKPTKSIKSYLLLIYKKATSIMLPYIFFSLFIFILNDSDYYETFHHGITFDEFLRLYVYSPISYLWFLYALFIIFLIIGLLDLIKINNFWQFVFCLLLLSFQLHFRWQVGGQPQCGICSFMLFFWMGKMMNQYKFIIKYLNRFIYIISLVTIVAVITLLHIFAYSKVGYINNDSNNITYLDIIPKILVIPIVFWLSNIFEKYNICTAIFNYFDKYGKYTLVIYLVHYYVAVIFGYVLSKLISYPIINLFILFLIVWYICIGILLLSKKIQLIHFIFYPRQLMNRIVIKTKWGHWLLG